MKSKTSPKRTPATFVEVRAPKPVNEDSIYRCIICKQAFADAEGFKVHHILKFSPKERCLDTDELRCLCFEQRKNGVWARNLLTQILPSQIARLASVRQDIEGPLFGTRATPVPRVEITM